MDIDNLIKEKLSAMSLADKNLLDKVKSKQEEILKKILQLLAKFAGENGKIDKRNPTNKSILNLLNKELNSIINKSTFRSPVSAYLKVFDDVEFYSKKILESENGLDLKDYNLNSEKQLAIEEIANGLLSDEMLRNNLANPIKKIMYRHVSTGVSYFDAQKELTNFISNNPDKLGFAEKYVAVLTREAISRYDGMINQKVAVDFGLDAFRIVGSLIVTSEPQCVHMISQTGPFEGMVINGKYAMSDLPQIINILSRYKGFVRGTNESNYFINRNHWGCRHVFVPTRFLKRDKEAMLQNVLGATGPQVGDDLPVVLASQAPLTVKSVKNNIIQTLSNEGFNIKSVSVSNTLDVESLNRQYSTIKNLFEEYKISDAVNKKEETTISFKSGSGYFGRVSTLTRRDYSSTRIKNINFGDNYDKIGRNYNELNLGQRFKSRVDEKNLRISTTVHEFAHVIAMQEQTYIKGVSEDVKLFFKELDDLRTEYKKILFSLKDNGMELNKVSIGKYAMTNINEFMAEGFTEYKLSSNPTPTALKIGKLIDKYFKK